MGDWNLISLLSEAELGRLFPGIEPSKARVKLTLMELKSRPGNESFVAILEDSLDNKERENIVSVSVDEVLAKFLSFSQVQDSTRRFYRSLLSKSLPTLGLTPKPEDIVKFRDSRKCKPGGKHSYHRSMRAFYNWLYSPASGYPQFRPEENPMQYLKSPKVPKRTMPAQDMKTIQKLFSCVESIRDAAIIAVLIDTGGRRAEISNIREHDVLWDKHSIRAIAKGNKEVLMPFGPVSEKLLKQWLSEYHPKDGNIWGINENGIVSMLRRLERKSGIKCNAHTFRRGFASMLRKSGVDTLDIMQLGHWSSLPMVQRYTESVNFEDSQKHYKAPMERLEDSAGRLPENEVVPRPRIELGTRRFSVYQQDLCLKILQHLRTIGQAADLLLTSLTKENDSVGTESTVESILSEYDESPLNTIPSVSALKNQGDPERLLNEKHS